MNSVTMEGFDKMSAIIAGKVRAVGTVEFDVIPGGRRGPQLNALIAHVQQARERNPWYLAKESKEAIRFTARGLASLDYNTVSQSIRTIGTLLLDAVRVNVENQRNADGTTFRELTARYAAFKRRKHGFIHSILKATNDLLGGLRVAVTRTT